MMVITVPPLTFWKNQEIKITKVRWWKCSEQQYQDYLHITQLQSLRPYTDIIKKDLAELIKGGEWNDNNSYNNILIKENT